MSQTTVAKLVLALAGIVVFFYAVYIGSEPLRWIGIVLVAIGVLLRFYRPRKGPDEETR